MRTLALLALLAGCGKETPPDPDPDGDGALAGDDCSPYDATVAPSALEVCNGRDDDCDGTIDEEPTNAAAWFADGDGDGWGTGQPVASCLPPDGHVVQDGDCDDTARGVHPGADETCADPIDRNCDGVIAAEDGDGDGFVACEDCDDTDDRAYPGAEERCNGADDDCDATVDEDAVDADTFHLDLDGDGFGALRVTVEACEAPAGFVDDGTDCDDLSAAAWPGAPETCDGTDEDCDGAVDDGATDLATWYADADGDGFGAGSPVTACGAPSSHVASATDCDDAQASVFPGAPETCADATDRNCDGTVGQADGDGDGTRACDDCDDARADVFPSATELCDGVDNDCDAAIDEDAPTWYADADGDGHGGARMSVVRCAAPAGYVATSDDCDDLDPARAPGATERCNAIDDDCDGSAGTDETDVDGDGVRACAGDCDDAAAPVRPGAIEHCDGVDEDCDSAVDEDAADRRHVYADTDGDGAGDPATGRLACATGSGLAATGDDCDDADATVAPGAAETCDGVDEDCDGAVDDAPASGVTAYRDADGDGVGGKLSAIVCAAGQGWVTTTGDCDDTAPDRRPGATEVCNGADDDCDTSVDESPADGASYYADQDKDGFGAGAASVRCAPSSAFPAAFAGDCDDANPTVRPGAPEVCDGKDNDCDSPTTVDENPVDGFTVYTDADGDGYGDAVKTDTTCGSTVPSGYAGNGTDCNDGNKAIHPGAADPCNGKDDDCDGDVDIRRTDAWDPAVRTTMTDIPNFTAGNANYTLSFWVYPRGTIGGWGNLVHRGNSDGERVPAVWFIPGTTSLHVRQGTTADWNQGCDTGALALNDWTHVAVVKDGDNLRVYYDGVQTRACGGFTNTLAYNAPFYIGNPWYAPANARLAELRVQCRAEPAADIVRDIANDGY